VVEVETTNAGRPVAYGSPSVLGSNRLRASSETCKKEIQKRNIPRRIKPTSEALVRIQRLFLYVILVTVVVNFSYRNICAALKRA
jgi:hypothetical protein